MSERERFAKIIDPDAWERWGKERGGIGFACFNSSREQQAAFAKADEIIAPSLAKADAIIAAGGVAQAAPTPAEWAAKEHDEWASNCRYVAQKTREEWTGPDYSSEDNKANHAEAREYDRKAAYHEQSARHFREMGLAVSSTERGTPDESDLYNLRDLIASHFLCDDECCKYPSGCGCALTAARAVLSLSRPERGGGQSDDHQ